jgi:hypothetical protein
MLNMLPSFPRRPHQHDRKPLDITALCPRVRLPHLRNCTARPPCLVPEALFRCRVCPRPRRKDLDRRGNHRPGDQFERSFQNLLHAPIFWRRMQRNTAHTGRQSAQSDVAVGADGVSCQRVRVCCFKGSAIYPRRDQLDCMSRACGCLGCFWCCALGHRLRTVCSIVERQ